MFRCITLKNKGVHSICRLIVFRWNERLFFGELMKAWLILADGTIFEGTSIGATGKTIGEVLLTPTRIYVRPVMDVLGAFGESIHGMVHITGGGFYENVPRMYAKGKNLVSVIKKDSWPKPAIFEELIRRGADPEGVWGTFNMGIGFNYFM